MGLVRWSLLFACAIVLAVVQHTTLGAAHIAPDLPLALAVWAVVDGSPSGLLWRAWCIGFIVDAVDPGSQYFHLVAYTVLGLMAMLLRPFLFRRHGLAWGLVGSAAAIGLRLADGLIGGFGDGGGWILVINACLTGLTTTCIGWMMGVMPPQWRPAGRDGA
jgi:hypothetical protein